MNSYEEAARERKVSAMMTVIDRAATEKGVGTKQIVAAFEKWQPIDWDRVDRLARLKKKSSKTTRDTVVSRYKERLENDNW